MSKPQKIDTMYAFIATEASGDEGVTGFQHDGQWFPMVGADWKRVESLRDIAQEIARQTGCKVSLCKFSVREEVEDFDP